MHLGRFLLLATAFLVILGGLSVTAFAFWLDRQDDLVALLPAAEVSFRPTPGGTNRLTIDIDGLLTPATATRVELLLKAPPGPVDAIRIRSGGGAGDGAARLARLANGARLAVHVDNGAVCSSACVIFLAEVDAPLRSIAPGAWLRVHGRSTGPADPRDTEPSSTMDAWVRTISPAWYAYLAACPSKPLSREAGIAMTWAEVQAIEAGGPVSACAGIAYRTKDWLFGGRPGPRGPVAVTVTSPRR